MTALMWKEWRENRLGFLIFLASGVLMQSSLYSLDQKRPDLLVCLTLFLLAPAYIGMVGASVIAPEVGEKTLAFLLSRPMARWRIWTAKTLFGALLSALATIALLAFCGIVGPARGTVFILPFVEVTSAFLFIFSSAVFCSTLFSRAMPGFLTSILLVAAFGTATYSLDLMAFVPAIALVGSVGLLATSLTIFCWGELLTGYRQYVWALTGLVATTATLYCVLHGIGLAFRWSAAAPYRDLVLKARDRSVIVYTSVDSILGVRTQIVSALSNHSPGPKVVGSPCSEMWAVVPDGSGYIGWNYSNHFGLPVSRDHDKPLEFIPFSGSPVRLEIAGHPSGFQLGYPSGFQFSKNGQQALFLMENESLVTGDLQRIRYNFSSPGSGVMSDPCERLPSPSQKLVLLDLRSRQCETLAMFDHEAIRNFCWTPAENAVRFLKHPQPGQHAWSVCEIKIDGGRAGQLSKIELPEFEPLESSPGRVQPHLDSWQLIPGRKELLATNTKTQKPFFLLVDPIEKRILWSIQSALLPLRHVSPDGRWGMAEGYAPDTKGWHHRLLDFERGRIEATWPESVTIVGFSPDSRKLSFNTHNYVNDGHGRGTWTHQIHVRDLATGTVQAFDTDRPGSSGGFHQDVWWSDDSTLMTVGGKTTVIDFLRLSDLKQVR